MRYFLFVAVLVSLADFALGQGGPPMITDDPGTPGDGHWENNLAIAFEHRPNEWSIDAPAIDLNYGWGDRIQLTLQTSAALLKRSDHGLNAGLGGTEAALKCRFFDEERTGIDMSVFPRVIFNVLQSSVRRGLSEPGTRFQIPAQMAKKFGSIEADLEFGPIISTVGRGEWLYGVVAGSKVTARTELMAELHGTSRVNFTRDTLALNFGFRRKFNDHSVWIGSLGHELRTFGDEPLALIGYCGVQLVY